MWVFHINYGTHQSRRQTHHQPKATLISACKAVAGPCMKYSWLLISKRTVFTCTTVAPAPKARRGSSAARYTRPEVPIDKSKSQLSAAARPALYGASGSTSPNHTTPGLTYPLQALHRGGSRRPPSSDSSTVGRGASCALPQSMHLGE